MLVAKIYIVLATLGASALSKPISSIVHERRDSAPDGFTSNGPADESSTLNLRILLTSNDLFGLEKAVYQNAYRGDGVFREPMTRTEIQSFVAPTVETTTKVTEWLLSNGINYTMISPAEDWLQINVNVSTANQMLDADFMSFSDDLTGKEVIRTLSYTVPSELKPHIQLMHPTIAFPVKFQAPLLKVKSKARSTNTKRNTNPITSRPVPSACNIDEITPLCVANLYDIPLTSLLPPQSASKIAVAAFSAFSQFPQETDLQEFLEEFATNIPSNTSFTVESVDEGGDSQNETSGALANALIEYTVGLAVNVPVEVISVGNRTDDTIDGYLDLVLNLLSQSDPPKVLLLPPGFDENSIPIPLAQTLCNSYMQLSSMGVSVIAASGDGGVLGVAPDSINCGAPLVATFPSTCPFVTSVGATSAVGPETAAAFSAGGFSNIFPTPSFQQSAVSQYLSFLGDQGPGEFNKTGRGFPDVSAHGDNMVLVVSGRTEIVSTTLISAAIYASFIGQLNAINILLGFPVLGLLNPSIYNNIAISTDITTGNSSGCGTNGFPATSGWDPVSGVGTPFFPINSLGF